ncbi:MAG: glycosyltransferase family 4 protein [Acholeplasmatales bacterium]|nr:glycosyltransferase family 4 protein [Acholeplasmatales bacterium]
MNILFLNLLKFKSFEDSNIYTDLLREFIKKGHNVYAVCPSERRNKEKTCLTAFGNSAILSVKTFNIQKTNIFEKGIGMLLIKRQFIKAIKKYFKGKTFDLILYPTPPITLYGVVKYFKRKNSSRTYLMLKDIFPQNAVDLGLMKKTGLKGLLYRYFRKQERKLYAISDKIGCMSQANVEYVLEHNSFVEPNKIEVFPNCIDIKKVEVSDDEKIDIKKKYNLPFDKKIFVYGGNLGKPQGIPFIIDCMKAESNNENAFFLIVGDGTEYSKLEKYVAESNQKNLMLLKRLPSNEFDRVLACCDVGLIFLDYRFTIPNFPSRLLSYMQASLPVLACTDKATDIGKVIVKSGFGWACESNEIDDFCKMVKKIELIDLKEYKYKSYDYLIKEYNVKDKINIIEDLL